MLQFRLLYEGRLLSANANGALRNKCHIRRYLHPQLKRLWHINPILNGEHGFQGAMTWNAPKNPTHDIESLALRFPRGKYNFVPLVTQTIQLRCEIEILYLRYGSSGPLIVSGDIDNRLKTLFDSFQVVDDMSQIHKEYIEPGEDETPFFVLLEDDKLINKVSVDTDILLHHNKKDVEDLDNECSLVISIKLHPSAMNWENICFA